jgi:hypothetical protein
MKKMNQFQLELFKANRLIFRGPEENRGFSKAGEGLKDAVVGAGEGLSDTADDMWNAEIKALDYLGQKEHEVLDWAGDKLAGAFDTVIHSDVSNALAAYSSVRRKF